MVKKKINCRAKGRRNEKRTEKELIYKGWIVYLVKGTSKFNKNVDIFSMFDCLAFSEYNGIKLIQIKTNSTGGMLHKIKDFSKRYNFEDVSYELWKYMDRGDTVKYIFKNGKKK